MHHDIRKIREDFPFFTANPHLVYLDSSATSQRYKGAVEAASDFYLYHNASPLRGLYDMSIQATESFEAARQKTADFIHAGHACEIIFTRNASESFNLLASSLCSLVLKEGDEIIVGITEHHSNMLPWRDAAARFGATVTYWECDSEGYYSPESLQALLKPNTRIVTVTQMSNVFGLENDIKTFARLAHENGSLFVADGAQSVPHMPVDVQDLDVDFLCFSGHKMLAPFGIGVLYGKKKLLDKMPPYMSGGEMIDIVTRDRVKYSQLPHKFEAGTVNAGGAIALGAAIDYYNSLGFDYIQSRESELTAYMCEQILNLPHFSVMGSQDPREHHGIVTFKIEGVHPHDISAILSQENICIRAGHHCAHPLHQHMGVMSSTRASLMFYNTKEEIDRLISALSGIRRAMGYEE
ncbi:MAG: SufS family cysteine desulfurase [Lachnospiraceae bacterium]|nr:SufS family cysteine desulfurase [Lachnospiraceae bacterium]